MHDQDVRLRSDAGHEDDHEEVQERSGPAAELLAMQMRAGNRAVASAVQARLKVGSASDLSEVQAEAVADEIVGRHAAPSGSVPAADHTDGGEEAAGGAEGGAASPDLQRDLRSARTGGQGLPAHLRGKMEAALGADLGRVRVHQGDAAADLNRRIQAEAFTIGSDVFLSSSAPSLDSDQGQHLLAHELTHVVQQGAAQPALRRRGPIASPDVESPADPADEAIEGGEEEAEGSTYTLLEVVERLIEDLEGHERGFLIDLKPKRLLDELSSARSAVDKLKKRADKLSLQAEQARYAPQVRDLYDEVVTRYDELQSLRGWFRSRTPEITELRARKHRIETELGTTGRKATRRLMDDGGVREQAILAELERTEQAMARLQRLMLEMQDRAIAFGFLLADNARAQGHDVEFPVGDDIATQVAWITQWSSQLPEVRAQQKAYLETTEAALGSAKQVQRVENSYAYHELSYNRLLNEYATLAHPGTSRSHSVRVTLSGGAGVEIGAFVQVTGKVATGDDRGVSPSLTFEIGVEGALDVGLWKASASVSISVTMSDSFDNLEHFVAHYMKLLSLYNGSFIRYAKLKGKLDNIPPAEYAQARRDIINEAQERGFVEEGDTVTIGSEAEKQLLTLQRQAPILNDSVSLNAHVGIGEGDDASLPLGPEFSLTASYTRKWYRRLVDYNRFVADNEGEDTELAHLKEIRQNYLSLIAELDQVRSRLKAARKAEGDDPEATQGLADKEAELQRLKNVYEHGHLTLFSDGRKSFLKQINAKIASLSKVSKRSEDVDGTELANLRAVDDGRKKALWKSENVYNVDLSGAFSLGPISAAISGSFTRTTTAGAPNSSTGMSWSLSLAADTGIPEIADGATYTAEALAAVQRAGAFQLGATDAPPGAGESFRAFIEKLAALGETLSTVLASGITITGNLTWINGAFHTQYVRLLRARSIEVKGKARYEGANLAGKYTSEATDFITEWMGTTTLSYLQTVYQGLQGRPNGDHHWETYAGKHRQELWQIMVAATMEGSNPRRELAALPGGAEAISSLDAGLGVFVNDYYAREALAYGGGDAAEAFARSVESPPRIDNATYDQALVILSDCLRRAAEAGDSLNRSSLRSSGWESVEGTLDSQITQSVQLDGGGIGQAPTVASKNALTRRIKGESESHLDLSYYGTFRNIADAGARLVLVFEHGASKPYRVTLSPSKSLDKQLRSASKALAKWIDLDAVISPAVVQARPLSQRLRDYRRKRWALGGDQEDADTKLSRADQEKQLASRFRKDEDKLPQAAFDTLVNVVDSSPASRG